ncbi:MAG TPA: hypothetical protein VFZ91_07025 [Allosphingosinicella sp.]
MGDTTQWLLEWAQFLAVLLLIWALLAFPAYLVERALQGGRFRRHLTAMRKWLWSLFLSIPDLGRRARGAVAREPRQIRLRIVADERLEKLRLTMHSTAAAIRDAASDLEGLTGRAGPGDLRAEVLAVQNRAEEVAKLGGEIDADAVLGDYRERSRGPVILFFLFLFTAAVAVANGVMLGAFFRDWVPGQFFGFRLSQIAAILFVILEIGTGFALSLFHRPGSKAFLVLILAATLWAIVEAMAFGSMSNSADFDIALFETYPVLKFWLAPFGLAMVIVTTAMGYALHQELHNYLAHRGDTKFRREAAQINKLLQETPERWEAVRRKASAAVASIGTYEASLGSTAENLGGTLDRIAKERNQLIAALAAARLDDWRNWIPGEAGDNQSSSAIDVLFALATLLAGGTFVWGAHYLIEAAFSDMPLLVRLAIALGLALGCYFTGFRAFGRIHYAGENGERAEPLRTGAAETAALALLSIVVLAALVAIGFLAFGPRGLAMALGLAAVGAVLAILGYYMERFAVGLPVILAEVVGLVLGAVAAIVVFVVGLVGALLCLVGYILWWAIYILAFPVIYVLRQLRRRRNEAAARAARPAPAGASAG